MLIAGDRKQCALEVLQTIERKIGPDGDDNIAALREPRSVTAKNLSNQSLDPVTPHRVANLSLDAYPQTIPRQGIFRDNNGKSVSVKPPPGPIDTLKLPIGSQ